ncbi:Ecdysteroid kinase-domain-containing protein [Durotheca rogersii]|uniref:Ecdysteroid kinase-domain-containing protein n=1 Tax=Durotheca rogersii TaxID=419775 RepID=UPI002220E06D|nr:Ecdysteroid kinase-domain-containing protein [Durotheca rogersii]KAI5865956.1 Ecdysteroid kinase-domain-containing protein [Durotheca rogersii]
MPPPVAPERAAAIMLSWKSLALVSCRKLQTLWAGYGYIYEVTARATSDDVAAELRAVYRVDGAARTGQPPGLFPLILKFVTAPPARAGSEDEGHLRKLLSYDVEQCFYHSVAPHLEGAAAVAHCVLTTAEAREKPGAELLKGVTATILTDLRPCYPVAGGKRSELNKYQIYAALDWLASFHRSSRKLIPEQLDDYVRPPLEEAARRQSSRSYGTKLWLNGGYTYLATRRKEYADLADDDESEWSAPLCAPVGPDGKSIAELVADFLTPRGRKYETLIHGDVKSENLFTTQSGRRVAFFDFQYVGIGLGVCDLAKLFTCSVPLGLLIDAGAEMADELGMNAAEKALLEHYRSGLLVDSDGSSRPLDEYDWDVFVRHWETALVDWLRFQASWGFWGNTEWLEARVRSITKDRQWRDWLQENCQKSQEPTRA